MMLKDMKTQWVVVLDKQVSLNNYHPDYCPRSFRYKRDAEKLVREIKENADEAHFEKIYWTRQFP